MYLKYNQGDGNTISSCQYTYTGHKKSILSLTFLESLRYAVTCDGVIHCWDPFMGSLLGCPESSRPVPVNILVSNPSPSTTLFAGTTDITLRVIDCRTFQYVNEMKVSTIDQHLKLFNCYLYIEINIFNI